MAGLEDAAEFTLPFGMGSIDMTSPASAVVAIVALIGGATLWNMANGIGQNAADKVNSFIGNIIGMNPATGESAETGGAFD